MCVYLRTKFQVSTLTLTTFKHSGIILPPHPQLQSKPLKRLGLKSRNNSLNTSQWLLRQIQVALSFSGSHRWHHYVSSYWNVKFKFDDNHREILFDIVFNGQFCKKKVFFQLMSTNCHKKYFLYFWLSLLFYQKTFADLRLGCDL